jgi:MerR family transcriptional regulator, aldehyde-responsive regulator
LYICSVTQGVLHDEMAIKDLAAASGLSIHTLRYYERIGLIGPVPRLASGHRRYSRETAERVESLSYLRATGLSIEDMRTYLRNVDRGESAAADHAKLLGAHAEEIAKDIERLEIQRDYITAKAAYWQAVADGVGESPKAQRSIERARELSKQLR